MPVKFDVPDDAPTREISPKRRKTVKELKMIFDNPDGKRMIRDSMALKPISKENRRKELERMRVSFKMDEDMVTNLKSCLMVKSATGEIDSVKWKDDGDIVETFRISKVRASCWDDMFYTEDELADFKYQAFMEECGLDPDEFE